MKLYYMDPDEREAKLPRWAQRTINSLRKQLEESAASIQEIGEGSGNLIIDPYSDAPIHFRSDRGAMFVIGEDEFRVQARRDRPGLYINANTRGDMVVSPEASNAVTIRAVKR